jgi:hypothetical protein
MLYKNKIFLFYLLNILLFIFGIIKMNLIMILISFFIIMSLSNKIKKLIIRQKENNSNNIEIIIV